MEKDAFLARVRGALGRSPGDPVAVAPTLAAPLPTPDRAALVDRFVREHSLALGKVHRVRGDDEARTVLAQLLEGATGYARTAHSVLDRLGLSALPIPLTPPETAAFGITGAELGVAATGGVLLSSAAGRLAALLPPRHVIVLDADQLVFDLPDAWGWIAARGALPSAFAFHTGPSRSADIEQTMALGVHGPGAVDVLLIET